VGIDRVLRNSGWEAPTGEALLRWKLAQRIRVPDLTLESLITRFERDLSLRVRASEALNVPVSAFEGSVAELLDAALLPSQLCYRIRGDEIIIGTLEELLR
jgi:hypothetical protein